MAAGLGFKTFATGDVLSAGDTNGYLMQGVLVFASAAARDAAITSPQEGQFAYLKDTDVTTYYTGSAWANLDTTGMTNPMTTTGDTIYSSSGSTPARRGIGSTGQVLTVSGGIPVWASPAGGLTLIKTQTIGTTVSSVAVTSAFSSTYANYLIVVSGLVFSTNANLQLQLGSTTTGYYNFLQYYSPTSATLNTLNGNNTANFPYTISGSTGGGGGSITLINPNLAVPTTISSFGQRPTNARTYNFLQGTEDSSTQHTDFTFLVDSGTVTGGTIKVYGYANS